MAGAVGGTLLVLLAIVAWASVTAPRRQLVGRVDELQAEVQELAAMIKPEPTTFRIAFGLLREEVRDNARLMKAAAEAGKYWRLTESTPSTKQWKKHRELLRQEPTYADLYEKARVAAQDVERILQARSVRTFVRRNRGIDQEDRLPEVIECLTELERSLTAALDPLEPRGEG